MPTAPDNYATGTPCSPTPPHRGVDPFDGIVALVRGPFNPGLATLGSCKFYKVDSLAVATRMSHNYQVLLDDGNRIIIPQGNFKVTFLAILILGIVECTGNNFRPVQQTISI